MKVIMPSVSSLPLSLSPAPLHRTSGCLPAYPQALRIGAATLVAGVCLFVAGCATTPQSGRDLSASPNQSETLQPAAAVDTAKEDALRARIALQDRMYRVAAPLLVKNLDLCKNNARKLLGFTAKNKYSYTEEYVDAAERALGLGDRLQIMAVLAGSSAARAGLHPGDVLIAVDEKPMPRGPNAERQGDIGGSEADRYPA